MISRVPMPQEPNPGGKAAPAKPWTVAVQFEDPQSESAQKLRALSAAFGKKPGPYLAEIIRDWLDGIDLAKYQQEELFIDKAS